MLTSRSQGASRNIKEWDQQEGYQVPICSNQNLAGGSCSEPELLPHPSSGFTHTTPGGCHGDRGHSDWLWLIDIIGLCLHLWPTSSYTVIIPQNPAASASSKSHGDWQAPWLVEKDGEWSAFCGLFSPQALTGRILRLEGSQEEIVSVWFCVSLQWGCVAGQNLLKT